MNIYDYIDNFGIYTFAEKEFNEIDAAIFAYLSYANLEKVMMNGNCTIKEAGRVQVGTFNEKEKSMTAVKAANKILRYIKDTTRYKVCILKKYEYIGNEDIQFGVVSIEYLPKKIYVSYEGTNELVSGWKEDIMLSLQFPTPSHRAAISYINRNFAFRDCEIIVGGHSKGGNLALIVGMYANYFIRKKIKKVYSFDGPGLLEKEFESRRYKYLEKKYQHFISDYSVIGLIFFHRKDVIVKSRVHGLIAHHVGNWEVEKDHFKKAKLSPFSKEIDKQLLNFVKNHDDEAKKDFVKNFESIMKKVDADSLLDFGKDYKKIIKLVYETKGLSQNTKDMVLEFLNIIFKCYKEDIYAEIKTKISNTSKSVKKIRLPKLSRENS